MSRTLETRAQGALLGLALGDALGTTLEFRSPGSFTPISDMLGGGPFDLPRGYWTDDTSMALCLAHSLVERRCFDASDQMQRYCRWWHEGYMSSTGSCFDIGNTVRSALRRFEQSGDPMAGSEDPRSAGNGSLMRLVPVVLACAHDHRLAIMQAAAMSRTTHAALEAVDACRYYAGLIYLSMAGADKAAICASCAHPAEAEWAPGALAPEIERVARGSFKIRQPPAIRGTGYVVDALEAALWAFWTTESFREGALAAANLGDDADTTAAIFGQLAGAYYGREGLPADWLEYLLQREEIAELALQLVMLESAEG